MPALAFRIAALMLVSVAASSQSLKDDDARTKVGDRMPPISVQQLAGGTFSLAHEAGKVVVVNFWATWCGPCQLEMPQLETEVWQKYRSSPDFAMVAIAREQTASTVAAFKKTHANYTFPLAMDPDRAAFNIFAHAGIPRSYVVNRHGLIVYQSVGYSPDGVDKMEVAVRKALADK